MKRALPILSALLCVAADAPLPPIDANQTLERVPESTPREQLAAAAQALGDWSIDFAGVPIDGDRLQRWADCPADEPLLRFVREDTGRAIDLDDFVYFLDDVLVAGQADRRGQAFTVTSGRARSAGLLVHPDDVFKNKPRQYGVRRKTLSVDAPQPPDSYPPATDGDPPSPGWSARFQNPQDRPEMYWALVEGDPNSAYASRVASLIAQLEQQGAEVWLTSTVRNRHRGYLMWGAFELSRAKSEAEVNGIVKVLDARNSEWKLDAPISWTHPDGWEATREGGRQMADAYDVVYATEKGARYSNHYGAAAVDLVAIALPRTLTLQAPDGATREFDLSDPQQTRDFSLTPELIEWVEKHFNMSKLKSDYPHWNDKG